MGRGSKNAGMWNVMQRGLQGGAETGIMVGIAVIVAGLLGCWHKLRQRDAPNAQRKPIQEDDKPQDDVFTL